MDKLNGKEKVRNTKHVTVSNENYTKLLVLKGKKILETEKEVSFDDVIADLLKKD